MCPGTGRLHDYAAVIPVRANGCKEPTAGHARHVKAEMLHRSSGHSTPVTANAPPLHQPRVNDTVSSAEKTALCITRTAARGDSLIVSYPTLKL